MQDSWIILALVSPFLWAVSNHIDKFLITRYAKEGDVYGLVVISALAGLLALPFLAIFSTSVFALQAKNILFLILSGLVYVSALIFYLKAFSQDEASRLAIVFNSVPLFAFLLAFLFLGERLGPFQVLGGIIILLGASLLSIRFKEKNISFHLKPVVLMLVASFLFASFFFLFKFFGRDLSFSVTMFWQYIGWFIGGVSLLIIPVFRSSFFNMFRRGSYKLISINVFNEAINVVAVVIANSIYLLAPLALVSVTFQGYQSIFVVAIGVILTNFLPKYGKEDLHYRYLILKGIAIALTCVGVFILSVF